jgi:hypothetical protein
VIWYNVIPDGVKRCVASGNCVMGAKSMFSASTIEEKGYAALFWDGQVLFMPRGYSSNTAVVSELERAMCIGRKASVCEPWLAIAM